MGSSNMQNMNLGEGGMNAEMLNMLLDAMGRGMNLGGGGGGMQNMNNMGVQNMNDGPGLDPYKFVGGGGIGGLGVEGGGAVGGFGNGMRGVGGMGNGMGVMGGMRYESLNLA